MHGTVYLTFMPFPPDITNPRNLSERFAQLIGRLQRALFTCMMTAPPPPQTPVQQQAWHWMYRLRRRFEALAERQRAGTLPALRPPQPLPAAPPPAAPRPTTSQPAAPRPPNPLPRKSGWLLKAAYEPWQLNAYRPQLQAFLADPELASLAAEAPQVGRLLRPLCHMLHEPLPLWLQLPKRPRRPRPKKPKPPKKVDINRMSAVAWGNYVHPDRPGQVHPPARIGYGGSWWPPKKSA